MSQLFKILKKSHVPLFKFIVLVQSLITIWGPNRLKLSIFNFLLLSKSPQKRGVVQDIESKLALDEKSSAHCLI